MPELPEVETVRRGLADLLPGHTIKSVKSDWAKSFPNAQTDVDAFLIGAKVSAVRRRAKVLMIDFDTNYSLVIHLKMTGQLVIVKGSTFHKGAERFGAGHPNESLVGNLPDKSTRVILYLDEKESAVPALSARKQRSAQGDVHGVHRSSTRDGDTAISQERWQSFGLGPKAGQRGTVLYFNDQRKFGWMRLLPTIEIENLDFFKKVGPEPLNSDFTPEAFIDRAMRRKNSNIKSVLLDQTVLAGVGNIYADESLWGAKIHPSTLVKNISASRLTILHKEIIFVLRLAIEKGGSTDRNYVDAEGKKGSYMSFAKVFRRENLPCPRCGTAIVKIRVAGRGTHVCPVCQQI